MLNGKTQITHQPFRGRKVEDRLQLLAIVRASPWQPDARPSAGTFGRLTAEVALAVLPQPRLPS